MALNRRQRRARTHHRPHVGDTPQQQMKALLKQPGKFHIVELPDQKSFVVKVTDREMPLFLTICGQLKGVLGHCEVTAATPVDATVADAGMIARQTSNDPVRLKVAQERTDAADAADEAELDASMARHPAGKKRPSGGRHAKPEPDTVFDQLARGAEDADTARRIAAMELAAAQDASVRAQEAADAAHAHLAEVYARSGELHNQHVLDQFTEQAGEAIAAKVEDGPVYELGRDLKLGDRFPPLADPPELIDQIERALARNEDKLESGEPYKLTCPVCTAEISGYDRAGLARTYHEHVASHRRASQDVTVTVGDQPIDVARQAAIDEALRQAHANANPPTPDEPQA